MISTRFFMRCFCSRIFCLVDFSASVFIVILYSNYRIKTGGILMPNINVNRGKCRKGYIGTFNSNK